VNVRPFTDADAPIVTEYINRDEELFYGRPGRITADDILKYLRWATEAWVWEEDGRILGSATFSVDGDVANVQTVVGADPGIRSTLLDRGEEFAREQGATRILTGAAEPDAAARRLFESRDYREVRRFYEMAIELTQEPTVPELPEGLRLDEIRDGEQRAFFDAVNEAFADHWEWHPRPFEEWVELRGDEHHDEHGPMWFVVRDGSELAAVTRNEKRGDGAGYVGAIGVRPAWRGRGLAKALLYRTFAEFWRRGVTLVMLDVDAQNETGAVLLYERVGMHVDTCGVAFEKSLA
jgi:ribosomal protein S18 acetylase RimI-like enzyme